MVLYRALESKDILALRTLRLLSLQQHPTAYSSSFEEESQFDNGDWEKIIGATGSDDFIIGAFVESSLVGITGFFRASRIKLRHKGFI